MGEGTCTLVYDPPTGTVFAFDAMLRIPRDRFEPELQTFVTNALDPWIAVVAHDRLVRALQTPSRDPQILEGPHWSVATRTRETPESYFVHFSLSYID